MSFCFLGTEPLIRGVSLVVGAGERQLLFWVGEMHSVENTVKYCLL